MHSRSRIPLLSYYIDTLLGVYNGIAAPLRWSPLDMIDRRCDRIDEEFGDIAALSPGVIMAMTL